MLHWCHSSDPEWLIGWKWKCAGDDIGSPDNNGTSRDNPGGKRFNCSLCGKSFRQKGYLKIHMTSKHDKGNPFRCKQCTNVFDLEGKRNNCMVKHTAEEHFKCEQCNKISSSAGNLKTHMLLHTGTKSIRCEQCKKQVVQLQTQNNMQKFTVIKRLTGAKNVNKGLVVLNIWIGTFSFIVDPVNVLFVTCHPFMIMV